MGLFKKKSDPISERAEALSAEIAALEAQIKKLSAQDKRPSSREDQASTPAEVKPTAPSAPNPAPAPTHVPVQPVAPQPRLRSTALPHHRQGLPGPPATAPSPVNRSSEEVPGIHSQSEIPVSEPDNELDVRKNDLGAFWQRFKTHFRGPPTSNPKLVNYLAAGSIQGLRPLRYERRVARNRFIVLVICLALVLWGLIAMFWKHH